VGAGGRAALLLALFTVPAHAASDSTIAGATCTLADAITAANPDTTHINKTLAQASMKGNATWRRS
jgi:hypothetical protein